MMPKQWFIYALCEPDTHKVRYVGYSVNPPSRYARHLSHARNNSALPVHRWIRKIRQPPVLKVLQGGLGSWWEEAETKWIAYYRGIYSDLLNLASGGRAGEIPKESRIRAGLKMRGRVFTPEWRAKISAAKTGKKRPDADFQRERLHKMAKERIGKKMSYTPEGMETKKRMGKTHAQNLLWKNLTLEQKAKRSKNASEQMKRIWQERKNAKAS